ncbi:hypothetical protein BH09BAC3_BH09BAC3_13120 [soil metagenome]
MSKILAALRLAGIDVKKMTGIWKDLFFFKKEYNAFIRQRGSDKDFNWVKLNPAFNEQGETAGVMNGQYFLQDFLVARKIFKKNPVRHIDVGSRIDGFVAHVAIFRKIEVLDIRPMKSGFDNISFRQADLMKPAPEYLECCDSISALHSLEHFGLGRYGDPIDYLGHLKAIETIHKMLQMDGTFYFSTPIGTQRVEFNSQRVFSIRYLLDHLIGKFQIVSFAYVGDDGELYENIVLDEVKIQSNCGCNYGCGIFELQKVKS